MSLSYAAVLGPGAGYSACVPWTDVSQWVKKVETQRGASTELDDIQAGTATITFDNENGFFSPGRGWTGNLLPPNVQTCGDTLGTTAGFTAQSGATMLIYGANAYAGTNSLKVTTPANTVNGWFYVTTDYVPVSVGQTVALSGSFRNTVTSGYPTLTLALSCHFVDANRQTLAVNSWSEADVTMAVGDGWHTLSWNATVPAGAVSAQFVIVNRAPTTGVGIFFVDALSISMTCPFANQLTNGVPIRLGAVQNGNMLPYQIANVDHWNDQTTGDIESFGLWSISGAYYNNGNYPQYGTSPVYSASAGGLQFGHTSGVTTNGALAYIVNDSRSRITYLPPGTYTLQFQLTGVSFGSGATMKTYANILNYPNAKTSPARVSNSSVVTNLTTSAQTVTLQVNIPSGTTGLTGLEIALTLPVASATASKVTVSQFQLIQGTTVPAFTPGDCYMPLFAGWVDSWITTTQSGSGLGITEADCTDQFRRFGNLTVGNTYESMILNDPHTINYWPLNDAASTTLSTVQDLSLQVPYPMSIVTGSNSAGSSVSAGITAGAASILTVPTYVVTPPSGGGVVHPNYAIGTQTISTTPQAGTSFQWKSNNAGNCGAASGKAQFPVTSRINANMPAVGGSGVGSFDCWFTLPTPSSGSTGCTLIGGDGGSTSTAQGFWVTIGYNTSASPVTTMEVEFNTSTFGNFSVSTNLWTGAAHHFCLTWSIGSGNLTWWAYIDGAQVGTNTCAYSAKPTASNMIGADMKPGGTTIYNTWIGQISDVVLTDSAVVNLAARAAMGHGTYAGTEVGHLALLTDVGAADTFTDCMDSYVQVETWPSYASGTVLTDALKATASEVGGRFFMGRTGNACYNSINHAPIRQVFQDSAGTSIDDGAQFSIDGDHVINFVMITTSDGTQYWAYSRASIDARGVFPLTINASYAGPGIAQTVANTLVQYHGQPIARVYGVSFTCINPTMTVQALGLDVGSRVTLGGLPVSATAATSNWIVQSIQITGEIVGGTSVPVVAVEMSPDLAAS